MSLTREECEKACKDIELYTSYSIDDNGYSSMYECIVQEQVDLFNELIKEHFDNPPLKLEELKVGMWVWRVNYWAKIIGIEGKKLILCSRDKPYNDEDWGWCMYVEGQFFRKQVIV